MKKFIIDKGSIDNFIRQVESQSRFTFTRKINRDLMASITEIIENGLTNHQQLFRAKIGNKIEYTITLSTKDPLTTIDLAVTTPTLNQPLCQESYLMPTKTLLPYTFKEMTRSILALGDGFSAEQLTTLLQTAMSKNSAMGTAPGGVGVIMDFQNEVLTCSLFSDEEIIHTLHFFVPPESVELGLNPTLYRYLSVDFHRYEGVVKCQKSTRFPHSIEGLVELVSGVCGVEEAKVMKLLHKLLYKAEYALEEISAKVIGGTLPEVVFSAGDKQYSTFLNTALITSIVNGAGEKYKTALRDSLIESTRKKKEEKRLEETPADKGAVRPSLHSKTAQKKTTVAEAEPGAAGDVITAPMVEPAPVMPGVTPEPVFQPLAKEAEISHKKKLADYQLETLLGSLKHINKPEQAYDEIVKFIGDEVEFKGKITHKDMLVIYHFSHDCDNEDLGEKMLKIDIKINRLTPQQPGQVKRLFCFTVDAKRSDIDLISGAFNYLRNMFN